MTATYVQRLVLSLFLVLPLALRAQSLEDKLAQSRKMQAQSIMGLDDQAMDSVLKEKKSQSHKNAKGSTVDEGLLEPVILDSLISGPKSAEVNDTAEADTSVHKGKA